MIIIFACKVWGKLNKYVNERILLDDKQESDRVN